MARYTVSWQMCCLGYCVDAMEHSVSGGEALKMVYIGKAGKAATRMVLPPLVDPPSRGGRRGGRTGGAERVRVPPPLFFLLDGRTARHLRGHQQRDKRGYQAMNTSPDVVQSVPVIQQSKGATHTDRTSELGTMAVTGTWWGLRAQLGGVARQEIWMRTSGEARVGWKERGASRQVPGLPGRYGTTSLVILHPSPSSEGRAC